MSKQLKVLSAIVVGILGSMIATILWESSLFGSWHTHNPLDSLLGLLGAQIQLRRIFFWGLAAWSLSSFVYIFLELRKITIHGALYFTNRVNRDVTEIVRNRVYSEDLRAVPATNTFLGGDPEDGQPKKLMIEYEVWGRRRKHTVHEDSVFKLR